MREWHGATRRVILLDGRVLVVMMRVRFVFLVRLVLNPIRVMLMDPIVIVAHPPITIMPRVLIIVVAEDHRMGSIVEAGPIVVRPGIAG